MAAIEHIQPSPVLSSPNMGTAGVRPGSQTTRVPVSAEQSTQQKDVQVAEKQVSQEELKKVVSDANVEMSHSNESITFGYEEKLGMLYVQVTDSDSGEVVREIPSKEFIAHRIAMREMIGLLLDTQA